MDLLYSSLTFYSHYKVRDKCPHKDRHLAIHLGGVDNHKDLLNGAGRSSFYQVLLYRPLDKWGCHPGRGWGAEGPTPSWIQLKPLRMSPGAGPGLPATLPDDPPEAVGLEMNVWTPSFPQHWTQRCRVKVWGGSKMSHSNTRMMYGKTQRCHVSVSARYNYPRKTRPIHC